MAQFLSLLIIPLTLLGVSQAGLLSHPVGYSVGFAPSAHAFAAPPPVHSFAAPLPVAPINVNTYSTTSHHSYSAAAPAPVIKVHSGFTPYRAYSVGPSFTKYSTPAHIPGVYSGPLPYDFSAPHDAFNGWSGPGGVVNFAAPVAAVGGGSGWDAPRTVVKFGRPITTTTTTYSTAGAIAGAAAVPAAVPHQVYAATPFAGPVGW